MHCVFSTSALPKGPDDDVTISREMYLILSSAVVLEDVRPVTLNMNTIECVVLF